MNPRTNSSRANSPCWTIILPIVTLLLATTTFSACSPGPTNKDIFELRSLCGDRAAAAENAENVKFKGSMLYTFRGHYDPATNRCVEKIKAFYVLDPKLEVHTLLDSQSHAVLATCRYGTNGPVESDGWECEINHKEAPHKNTEEFIDGMMGSDK